MRRRAKVIVEISLKDLVKLYEFASIGKVINGLLHNLNSPLQNLGMYIELMNHSRTVSDKAASPSGHPLDNRLERMEEEVDHINHLIKTTFMRANPHEDRHDCMDLGDFLKRELSFLNSNLYFKHHVQTEVNIAEELPVVSQLPEGLLRGLSWLMQSLVEELERQQVKQLELSAQGSDPCWQITLTASNGTLSQRFVDILNLDISDSRLLRIEHEDYGAVLSLAVLKSDRVSVTSRIEPAKSAIVVTVQG
jgi:signal transduction histidine kinase